MRIKASLVLAVLFPLLVPPIIISQTHAAEMLSTFYRQKSRKYHKTLISFTTNNNNHRYNSNAPLRRLTITSPPAVTSIITTAEQRRTNHQSITTLHNRRVNKNNKYHPSSAYDTADDPNTIINEIDRLKTEIHDLTNATTLNVDSPLQISRALFGTTTTDYNDDDITDNHQGRRQTTTTTTNVKIQSKQQQQQRRSTDRKILESLSRGEGTIFQKRLADLVLEYRALRSAQRRCLTTTTRTDSDGVTKEEGEVMEVVVPPLSNGFSKEEMMSTNVTTMNNSATTKALKPPPSSSSTTNSTINSSSSSSPTMTTSSPPPSSEYEQLLSPLFSSTSQISPYWHSILLSITKPTARRLVQQLSPHCPMGFDPQAGSSSTTTTTQAGKKGSLLAFVRDQKKKYGDVVILTRVGEFYEAFGIDAIILVQYCGLNPMANKAKAGTPIKNIQSTLNYLTTAGFRIAILEEAIDTDSSPSKSSGGSKSRLKNRMLSQIISAASPIYLFDLILSPEGMGEESSSGGVPAPRPHVGIINNANGYTTVEIHWDERTIRTAERLTVEAVACQLAAFPPSDPLFYVPSRGGGEGATLPFLPSRSNPSRDGRRGANEMRVTYLDPNVMRQELRPGESEVERASHVVLQSLLSTIPNDPSLLDLPSYSDFTIVATTTTTTDYSTSSLLRPHPLHVETASQLGLLSNPTIPPLLASLLPPSSPAATRRYLRRWLLSPPAPAARDAMAHLVSYFQTESVPLPPLVIPPIGTVMSAVRWRQVGVGVFRDLVHCLNVVLALSSGEKEVEERVLRPLMVLIEVECGLKADVECLTRRCWEAREVITSVVAMEEEEGDEVSGGWKEWIPRAFFERNEEEWRGKVRKEAVCDVYEEVERRAWELSVVVAEDFWGVRMDGGKVNKKTEGSYGDEEEESTSSRSNSPVVQDIFNNLIALKTIPPFVTPTTKSHYYHPRDRNNKTLRNRYTTLRVENALAHYLDACTDARDEVKTLLANLADTLSENGHLPAIVQSSHGNLALSAIYHHASFANLKGWVVSPIVNDDDDDHNNDGHYLANLSPYWLPRSTSTLNTFHLHSLFLLTAPNMSGKSTLLRSTAAALLLVNAGLSAPLSSSSRIRRFDTLFLRGASADVPTEDKSAFGAEVTDIAVMMRCCGGESVVFVDELGRGTSPMDGTALAGAVLEGMAKEGMKGMFATHLHDIFKLPLKYKDRVTYKRMAIDDDNDVWTYRLEDGVSSDSRAFVTARRFGLPEAILSRATEFKSLMDKNESHPHDETNDEKTTIINNDATHMSKMTTTTTPSLDLAQEIMKQLSKSPSSSSSSSSNQITLIPPSYLPPSSFEGRSCVYILELPHQPPKKNQPNDSTPPSSSLRNYYYAGETDSLTQRLSQHRAKGPEWAKATAVVMVINEGGKSEARNVETLLIRELARRGFCLVSDVDGRRFVR